jgi:peptide/nickel transport system substrate-binding protein
MRVNWNIGLSLAALLVASTMAFAACGRSVDEGPETGERSSGDLTSMSGIESGGTLRVGFSEALVDLDPHTSQSLQDAQLLENIYRGLTRLKSPDDPEPVGDIAESWEVSDDKLTWTFQLRDGITFHDGTPLTAADVKYSIDRIKDPKTVATAASDFDPVKKVEVVDARTIRFELSKPYSILPYVLQIPAWSAIIPKGSGGTVGTEPNGTGPFEFDSQVRNTSLTLKRFDGYWEPNLPRLDGIEFIYLPEENARINALRSDQVDMIDTVPLAQANSVFSDDSLSAIQFESSWVDELGLNNERKPFDQVEVRQAIAHAINRNGVAEVATFGLGEPVETMVAPPSPIKVESDALDYDPEKARRLLAKAGYPDGFDMTIAPCGGGAFPEMDRAAQVIVDQLKKVGINSEVENLEAGVWADKVITKRDYDAFVCGLINGLDPDGHTYRYFTTDGAFNFSGYKPPAKLDELLERGREVADPEKRSRIYSEAWDIINKDAPWIPLYNVPGVVAAQPDVRGYQPFPEFNLRYETVGFAGSR